MGIDNIEERLRWLEGHFKLMEANIYGDDKTGASGLIRDVHDIKNQATRQFFLTALLLVVVIVSTSVLVMVVLVP